MTLADKISDWLGPLPAESAIPRGGPFLTPAEWRTVLLALKAHPTLLHIVTAARVYREVNLPTPLAAAILNAELVLGEK